MSSRRVILMRHATAVGIGSGTDHARALTLIGRAEASRAGARVVSLGAEPHRVLSSSATRCRETVESFCIACGAPPLIRFDDALYNAAPPDLLGAIDEELAQPGEVETLLVVAHNPGISLLALDLARGNDEAEEQLRAGFMPATFATFEVDNEALSLSRRSARLIHFERPD